MLVSSLFETVVLSDEMELVFVVIRDEREEMESSMSSGAGVQSVALVPFSIFTQ